MSKFRKKPVVIEAVQLIDEQSVAEAVTWMAQGGVTAELAVSQGGPNCTLFIPTLEGTMFADWGDWIIRGVQGEFYPCKPEIFAATYEPVAD